MVSIIRLVLRVAHVGGSMLLFGLAAVPLIRDATSRVREITVFGGAITVRLPFWAMVLVVVVLLAGLLNAMLLRPSAKMKNDRRSLLRWRLMVYGMKSVLLAMCSPVLDTVLLPRLAPALVFGGRRELTEGDLAQLAAVVRLHIVLLATAVGAYCRFYREEAEARSSEIERKKSV